MTKHDLLKNNRIEWLAASLAFLSLLLVVLVSSQPRTSPDTLGDFKLVYASASGLLHSGDAYDYGELSRVFREASVAQPPDWYGRNPVYPFFTLFTISPVLLLPMLSAAYVWGCLGYLVVAVTAVRLARHAERRYGLGLGWRLAIVALMAASPLVSFALDVANLSVLSACLCIFVVTAEPEESEWLHGGALVLALLLKPHLAFWVVLALYLSRSDRERRIVWRASVSFGLTVAAMTAYLAWRHQLVPLLTSYSAMLHQEAVGGSMDFRNHQNFLVAAQITALGMWLGYWLHSLHTIALVEWAVLPLLGLPLLWASLRSSPERKDLLVSAWVAFGLLATYHRAHDGIVLFLLLPWGMARLRDCRRDVPALVVLASYLLFCLDVPRMWWQSLATVAFVRPLANLMYERQVATAALLLGVSLTIYLFSTLRV